jgi:hypothetical protein
MLTDKYVNNSAKQKRKNRSLMKILPHGQNS